ncbi:MAG: secretin N-terminal domain-containing protein [Candidatus Anammoxibacter sp.]
MFSFTLRGEEIGRFFLALSQQIPYNIVVSPNVAGMVTVDLHDVTLKETMDTLTSMLGLEYEIVGKNIMVSILKMQTRIFSLNYIQTKRSGSGSLSARTGLTGGIGGSQGGGGGGQGGGGNSSVSTTDDADVWTELEAGLAAMVSDTGTFVINKLSNIIMVNDFPVNIRNIAGFLERVEGSIQRQVLIEATVIEVSLFDDFKMGLNWSTLLHSKINPLTGLVEKSASLTQGLLPSESDFSFGVTGKDFSLLLNAMSEQGQLNIISSPKISTLNNQKAVIKVGREEIFFEPQFDIITSIDPNTGQIKDTRSEISSVTPRPVTVGIVLDVTPQISADDYIIMNVHPSITELVKIEEFIVKGEVFASAPVIDIRETDTVVRVKNGQTMVIAGMMQDKTSETINKVPLLGSIPIIGALFRKTTQSIRKTELVILLTPTILAGRSIDALTERELRNLELAKKDFHLGILTKPKAWK